MATASTSPPRTRLRQFAICFDEWVGGQFEALRNLHEVAMGTLLRREVERGQPPTKAASASDGSV